MIEPLLLTLVGAALIAGATYDATTLTIPNWISLVLVALFPLVALTSDIGWGSFGIHLAIGFASLLIGMALFAGGFIGGGDAKLFAAISLFMGTSVGMFVFAVALAGGVLAAIVLALRWLAASGLTIQFPWLSHLTTPKAGIPYGIAIAAGALFVLPSTALFALANHLH
jgi:prepilin peptidase CpaA